jgi:hypothetical protein
MSTLNNEDPGEPTSLEVVSGNALETMQRVEIDSQIATAKRYPRSMDLFLKRSADMACCDKETAGSCLYKRPVGRDPDTGEQKFAEGMSVRMAEIVAASYGNLRAYATLVEQTPRQVRARGMAIDLESNYASSSEVVESTVDKRGNPYSERQRALMAKVALSKARRDAIFQVVPRALARPVEVKVRALLFGDAKSLAERRAVVASWMLILEKEHGITADRIWAALGINGPGDLNSEKLETLTGLRSAVVDGDVTWPEAFPPIPEEEKKGTVFSVVKEEAQKPAAADKPAEQTQEKRTPPVVAGPKPGATPPEETKPETPKEEKKPAAPAQKPAEKAPAQKPAAATPPAPEKKPEAPAADGAQKLNPSDRLAIVDEVEEWILNHNFSLMKVYRALVTKPDFMPEGGAQVDAAQEMKKQPDAVLLAAQKFVRSQA